MTGSVSHDRWAGDVGAYVLGALEARERLAFEEHLRACPACREAVDEVAVLPALLDRVPGELVGDVAVGAGLPDEAFRVVDEPPTVLLADLLRVARREEAVRRRRRWVASGLAAAAVVVLAIVLPGSPVPVPWRPAATTAPVVSEAIELSPVVESPVTATVRLDDVAWGTRIELVCRHAGGGDPAGGPYGEPGPAPGYALVVLAADGGSEEVATWGAVADREVSVPASTLLRRADIVRVELRAADGTVLLAATT
ncbi:zf-HC2 domain-containing protein [Actinotalea solisilvae]|uniref:zf-HC2 domain-containing protein n=1 Tax=Actinotalea solisilvae TaxID=2072922 RepID=UPI0018F225E0|nr:zf-HC2 domain-containing protein [Actinotalea solisilvae]